ncbi:hypothetical protein L798_00216 [Zootermopsis nevadensis]|uniref:Uncharacterized protein n=2 Tax=Zootermopsis nevadensis TaxID=136037 RepID=A0A067QLJ7_ZOONE|nr:hypothetical protein L798_00216 [Zootermopsis nevadensis]
MWLPQTLLIFWVVTGTPLPTALAIIAAVSSEASAVVPILACLACDKNMRKALFGILGTSTSSTGKQDNFLGDDAI